MSFWRLLEYVLPNIILYQSLYFSLVLSRVCEREQCPAASHHTVKWWIFRELKQRVKMKAGLWWTEAMETRSNGLGRLHPQRFQRQLERWELGRRGFGSGCSIQNGVGCWESQSSWHGEAGTTGFGLKMGHLRFQTTRVTLRRDLASSHLLSRMFSDRWSARTMASVYSITHVWLCSTYGPFVTNKPSLFSNDLYMCVYTP